jgi:hypothetical protein
VHQCARFVKSPRDHPQAVKLVGSYLLQTHNKGMIYSPTNRSFEVFSDADFSGNWDASVVEFEQTTAQ